MVGQTAAGNDAPAELRGADAVPAARSWPPLELIVAPVAVLVLINVLTPTAALFPNQFDVFLYFQKATALAHGEVVYRDFAFEYPPLALVAMVVPYLAWPIAGGPDFEAYRWLFLGWQGVLLAALVVVATGIAERLGGTGAWADRRRMSVRVGLRMVVLAIAAAPSLAWRFDLLPAVLTALAVLATLHGRAAIAGIVLALGITAKLYPAVLIPILAIAWMAPFDARRLARFGVGLVLTTALVMLPVVLIAGSATWEFAAYQAQRGLQVETVPGGLLLLRAVGLGNPARLTFEFGAVHVAGPLASRFLAIQPWLTLAGLGALTILAVWRCRLDLRLRGAVSAATVVGLSAAAILVFLVTNKVFSVQYVVWLLPFAACLSRGRFWLAATVLALSVGIHPLLYDRLIAQDVGPVLLLNVRNGLVIALLAWVIAGLARGARPEASGG